MTSAMPPRDWLEIHWPDIAQGDASDWIAVLPLAATEQHGPHLPLGTDVFIAEAYLAEVRKHLADDIPATFLPLQPVGISTSDPVRAAAESISSASTAWRAVAAALKLAHTKASKLTR